ncbi:MAG: PDZ domain-containing protein [Polyangiaceae bacterium]|nr:PDZ domain-containing protein [Polyangiaceae bacterium]
MRAFLVAVMVAASTWSAVASEGTALAQPAPKVAPKAAPAAEVAPVNAASQAEARKLSDAFVNVAERVSPSVVQIDVTTREESRDSLSHIFGKGGSDTAVSRGLGSGVVFTQDGGILTNNHVIEDALSINVRLRDGRYLPAKLVGRDPSTDLAVVKVDVTGLTAARFADSDATRVGEWVVAIGSPFGFGYTVTSGVLSAKGRGGLGMNAIEDYLQTDASINPGNSGGPLCDLDGRVMGINTMVVGRGSGIGFAVPSNMARRVAEQILKSGRVERAWIGVGFQDLTPELASAMKLDPRAGALVNSISDGGPAAKSNMKPGDIIASVAQKPVHDGRELVREVLQHDVGKTVALEIIRDGKHYATQVTLSARPEAPIQPLPVQQQNVPQRDLGVSMRDLRPEMSAQLGLGSKVLPIITQVVPGSAGDRAGLKVNDVVVEADGITDPTTAKVLDASKDGQLLLRVQRGSSAFYAALKK